MSTHTPTRGDARINGVTLARPGEALDTQALRQRACTELLRQEAERAGLLPATGIPRGDGVLSEGESWAIEQLLDSTLVVTEPTRAECERHFAANPGAFGPPARRHVRHILYAVTQGTDVARLRDHAQAQLLSLLPDRSPQNPQAFAALARQASNCPSGVSGGDLGWLSPADCAPEFARPVFAMAEPGLLSSLVCTRYGFHVVECLGIEVQSDVRFEHVEAAVRAALKQRAWSTALRHYLQALASRADMVGVEMAAAELAES